MPLINRHLPFARLGPAIFAAIVVLAGIGPNRAEAFEHVLKVIVSDESVPACQEGAVLETIRSKFSTADDRVLKAGLGVGTIDRITQVYAGQNDPSHYARRYCEARATLNNGKATRLYYLVEQEAGFVGATWNVEFCLEGLDPWHVHDGRCHTVRHRWW
jgi:hypothetical protein